MNKRFASLLLALLLLALPVLGLVSCDTAGGDTVTLYVYNWGEYMSDGSEGTLDVNEMFEEWYYETYGVKVEVNYSTYSSNESMYAKISSGSVHYDVVVPSDYMIERISVPSMSDKRSSFPSISTFKGSSKDTSALFLLFLLKNISISF